MQLPRFRRRAPIVRAGLGWAHPRQDGQCVTSRGPLSCLGQSVEAQMGTMLSRLEQGFASSSEALLLVRACYQHLLIGVAVCA